MTQPTDPAAASYSPFEVVPQLVAAALPFAGTGVDFPANAERDLERLAAEAASPEVVAMLAVACAVMTLNVAKMGDVETERLIRGLAPAMQLWAQRKNPDVS